MPLQEETVGLLNFFSGPYGFSLFVLVGGALCFSLFSAGVAIFFQRRLLHKEQAYLSETALLKTALDDLEGLLETDDRCSIIWNSPLELPRLFGKPPRSCGAPDSLSGILAFETWLCEESALLLKEAVTALRREGHVFSLQLRTRSLEFVEASARISGRQAVLYLRGLTDERRAHAALNERFCMISHQVSAFEALLNHWPGCVWLEDQKGHVFWANKAYLEMGQAGGTAYVIGQDERIFTPLLREKGLSQTNFKEEGNVKLYVHDSLALSMEGKAAFFDLLSTRASFGQIASAGMAKDVTDSVYARDELRQTLCFYTQTLNQLAIAVAVFGSDRCLRCYNRAFVDLFGIDIQFLETRPDIGSVLDTLRVLRKLPEQVNYRLWRSKILEMDKNAEPQELWWHLPDGRALKLVATPHPQGGMTYTFQNVTEHLDLESRYNALIRVQGETLENLSEAVAVFGSNGRLRLWNPAFERLWGLGDSTLAERPHIRKVGELCCRTPEEKQVWENLQNVITTLMEHRESVHQRVERGNQQVLDCTTIPLPDGGTLVTFRDMTDSVHVERALIEKNKALEQADQLRNCFVRNVAHELRAPLTTIIGFTHLLSDQRLGPLSPKQKDYVAHISSSCADLLSIVNDILDLTVIDAGVLELSWSFVDIRHVLGTVRMSMEARLRDTGVSLRTEVAPDLLTFLADEKRLCHVLSNILTYILRYAERGSRISLSCTRIRGMVCFLIENDRSTLKAAEIPDIFGMPSANFLEKAREIDVQEGMLGLAVAKSFIGLHGGSLDVQHLSERGFQILCSFPEHAHRMMQAHAG